MQDVAVNRLDLRGNLDGQVKAGEMHEISLLERAKDCLPISLRVVKS